MSEPASETAPESMRLGVFHYMQPSAETSLYRNGRVLTRRDRDGSDSGRVGVDLEEREMAILDARSFPPAGQPTLAANGFELVRQPMADPELDFLDHEAVVRGYYPECAGIVRLRNNPYASVLQACCILPKSGVAARALLLSVTLIESASTTATGPIHPQRPVKLGVLLESNERDGL